MQMAIGEAFKWLLEKYVNGHGRSIQMAIREVCKWLWEKHANGHGWSIQITMLEAFKLPCLKHYHCHSREYSLPTSIFGEEALTLILHIPVSCISGYIRVAARRQQISEKSPRHPVRVRIKIMKTRTKCSISLFYIHVYAILSWIISQLSAQWLWHSESHNTMAITLLYIQVLSSSAFSYFYLSSTSFNPTILQVLRFNLQKNPFGQQHRFTSIRILRHLHGSREG